MTNSEQDNLITFIKSLLYYNYQTQDIFDQFKDKSTIKFNKNNLKQLVQSFIPSISDKDIEYIYSALIYQPNSSQKIDETQGLDSEQFGSAMIALKNHYVKTLAKHVTQYMDYILEACKNYSWNIDYLFQPLEQGQFVQVLKQLNQQFNDSDLILLYVGLSDFTKDTEKYRQQYVCQKIKKLYNQFFNIKEESKLTNSQVTPQPKQNQNEQKIPEEQQQQDTEPQQQQQQQKDIEEKEIVIMKEWFEQISADNQSIKTLISIKQSLQTKQKSFKEIGQEYDPSLKTTISLKQIQDFIYRLNPQINIKQIESLFQLLDKEKTQTLNINNIDQYLQSQYFVQNILQIFQEQEKNLKQLEEKQFKSNDSGLSKTLSEDIQNLKLLQQQSQQVKDEILWVSQNLEKQKQELKKYQTENDHNEKSLKQLQEEYKDFQSVQDQFFNKKDKEKNLDNMKNDHLETLLSKLTIQNQDIQNELDFVNREYQQVREYNNVLVKEKKEESEKVEKVQSEFEAFKTKVKSFVEENEKLMNQNEEYQKQIQEKEKEINILQDQYLKAKQKNKQIEDQSEEISKDKSKIDSQLQILQKALSNNDCQIKTSPKDDEDDIGQEDMFELLQMQIKSLKESNESYNQQLIQYRLQDSELQLFLQQMKSNFRNGQVHQNYEKMYFEQKQLLEEMVAENSRLYIQIYKQNSKHMQYRLQA